MVTKKYDLTVFGVVLCLIAIVTHAEDLDLQLRPVTNGMTAPNNAAVSPTNPSLLYVVDQPGLVWAVDLGTGQKSVFLDAGQVAPVTGPQTQITRELRDVIFHPQYALNGLLYTYAFEMHDENNIGQAVVTRWHVSNPLSPNAKVAVDSAKVMFGMRKTASVNLLDLGFDANGEVRLLSNRFAGGMRYGGSIPALSKRMLFVDFSDRVKLSYVDDDGDLHRLRTTALNKLGLKLRSVSIDADGELYVLGSREDNPHSGTLFKALATPGNIRWDGDGSFNANRNNFNTDEGGTATISVERVNGNEGVVSIDYTTIDQTGGGFATPDSEYTPTNGVLTWQDGEEGPKTFTIATSDDTLFEGSAETVDLEIANPTGGAELAPADQVIQNSAGQDALTGRLTINDNDLATAPVGEGRQGGGTMGGIIGLVMVLALRRRRHKRC